jgi:Domain of unknown function (DUF5916)/Carbohydrate family 9 binding domain-like
MSHCLRVLFLLPVCGILVALPRAAAEEPSGSEAPQPSLVLTRVSGPVVIDGNLDEATWSTAATVDRFYEISPGDNVEPPVQTTGLLGYDDEFLYVGVRCQDPDPSQIRAPYVDRDQVTDQDLVQIEIDARNEGRWSTIFRVNARGVQTDGIFDEATGADDYSPDFHYDSVARITAEGWSVEMKIPLSALRYGSGDPQTWRAIFFRLYPRRFRHQIASAPIPRDSNCWLCHSLRLSEITGLPRGSSLTYTPFVTGNASDRPGAVQESEQSFEAGGDVKWLPRPNLAIDLTGNPDFSQVESDAPQISINNRFALFFPEKRPFFLEGLDLFSSSISVVHTRTITDPDWGARLTGRQGDSAYTVMAVRDQGGGSLIIPGPAFSDLVPQTDESLVVLGRYRRTFSTFSLGALTTSREAPGGGDYNRVAGADFQWYPTVHDQAKGQLLWSSTEDRFTSGTDHALHLEWARTLEHLSWSVQFQDIGSDFRADNGFVPQTGIRRVQGSTGYNFYRDGIFRRLTPQISYDHVEEPDGALVSRSLVGGISFDGTVQGYLEWHPREEGRALDGRIFEQSFWVASARVLPSRRFPYLLLTARYGDEIDIENSRLGTGTTVTLLARISATDRLQTELSAERHWLDVRDGSRMVRAFLATVSRAKLTYALTSRAFSRVIGEWEEVELNEASADSLFSGSVLYGYRLNWQSILYVGYGNEPSLAKNFDRQQVLFVKMAYAFRQ